MRAQKLYLKLTVTAKKWNSGKNSPIPQLTKMAKLGGYRWTISNYGRRIISQPLFFQIPLSGYWALAKK